MDFEPRAKSNRKIIVLLVIFGLANIIFWFFGSQLVMLWQTNFLPGQNWQAVYLADGQIFIGRIRGINSEGLELINAYNLQLTTVESGQAQSASLKLQTGSAQNVSLVRWGFYQPLKSRGTIFINRSAVIFWETLDDDAQAVLQIKALLK